MEDIILQNLLAPAWADRARAEDAILSLRIRLGDESAPWPEEVQAEISALKPDPKTFLAAAIHFWAEVCWRKYVRMSARFASREPLDESLRAHWSSPHIAVFPMTPQEPPESADQMRGAWFWGFIERLGPRVSEVEDMLLGCLHHPDNVVWHSAEVAFGHCDEISDAGYVRYLVMSDKRGRNGNLRNRAGIVAKHTVGDRIALLMDGVNPGMADGLAEVRFAVIARLTGESARIAHHRLTGMLQEPWPENRLAELINSLAVLSREYGFEDSVVRYVREQAGSAHDALRIAVARYLIAHSVVDNKDILESLTVAPHPWLLMVVCMNLNGSPEDAPALYESVVRQSLGNYDGYDGEPHDSAVGLLVRLPELAVRCLPMIVNWWDDATAGPYMERDEVRQILRLAEALGRHAKPLAPGMKRAIRLLIDEQEKPELSLDNPEAEAAYRRELEAMLIESGSTPEAATATAREMIGGMHAVVDQLGGMQEDIDLHQAACAAERQTLYPEWGRGDPSDQESDDVVPEPEPEDELVTELRDVIARLE